MYREFEMVKTNFIIFLVLLVITIFAVILIKKYSKVFKVILFSLVGMELVYGVIIGVAAYENRPLVIKWEDVYDINYHELVDLIAERYECDSEIYFYAELDETGANLRINAKTGRIQEVDEKLSVAAKHFEQVLLVPYKGKYYSAKLIFEENVFKTTMKCYLYNEINYQDAIKSYTFITGKTIKENDFYKHIYADYYGYLKEQKLYTTYKYFDLNISFIPNDINLAPNSIKINGDYADGKFTKKSLIIKKYIVNVIDGISYIDVDFEEGFFILGNLYNGENTYTEMRCFIVGNNNKN